MPFCEANAMLGSPYLWEEYPGTSPHIFWMTQQDKRPSLDEKSQTKISETCRVEWEVGCVCVPRRFMVAPETECYILRQILDFATWVGAKGMFFDVCSCHPKQQPEIRHHIQCLIPAVLTPKSALQFHVSFAHILFCTLLQFSSRASTLHVGSIPWIFISKKRLQGLWKTSWEHVQSLLGEVEDNDLDRPVLWLNLRCSE